VQINTIHTEIFLFIKVMGYGLNKGKDSMYRTFFFFKVVCYIYPFFVKILLTFSEN
jgi:hypothetical protein